MNAFIQLPAYVEVDPNPISIQDLQAEIARLQKDADKLQQRVDGMNKKYKHDQKSMDKRLKEQEARMSKLLRGHEALRDENIMKGRFDFRDYIISQGIDEWKGDTLRLETHMRRRQSQFWQLQSNSSRLVLGLQALKRKVNRIPGWYQW